MMMGRWFGSYGYGGGMFDGWAMGFGMLFNLIFWLAIIYLLVRLIRGHHNGGSCCSSNEHTPVSKSEQIAKSDPIAIVRERYAKGEITNEEYQEMLAALKPKEKA